MAVCNLFRAFNKETGNVMMFSQYAEDLNKCYVQHDSYDVIPSRFVALDIDYSGYDNTSLPHDMQNLFENGCAWLRGNTIGDSWTPDKWTPERSSYLFWNTLNQMKLISKSTITEDTNSFDYFPQVKYVGNIDIHSFEEKDGVGYNEIYCYIPNKATETRYQVIEGADEYLSNTRGWCEGCSSDTNNIKGVLNPELTNPTYYHHKQRFAAEFMQDFSEIEYISQAVGSDSFEFNTVVVLYDIYVRDADANITRSYKNIPLAMFVTGNIVDGVVENAVKKYTNCDDAYGSGTSYGLRLCTRYTVTPNATTIYNVEMDVESNYAAFSQAMAAMAESQTKMNDLVESVVSQSNNINTALAEFRNSKTNVPYVVMIGEEGSQVPYWFINGKNTGVPCSGSRGEKGADGATPEIVTLSSDAGSKKVWSIGGIITDVIAEGQDGLTGEAGPWWYCYSGVPSGTSYYHTVDDVKVYCKEGDLYLDRQTGKWYRLNLSNPMYPTGTWDEMGSLKGPQGEKGEKGEKGDAGTEEHINWSLSNYQVESGEMTSGILNIGLNSTYVDASVWGVGETVLFTETMTFDNNTFVSGTVWNIKDVVGDKEVALFNPRTTTKFGRLYTMWIGIEDKQYSISDTIETIEFDPTSNLFQPVDIQPGDFIMIVNMDDSILSNGIYRMSRVEETNAYPQVKVKHIFNKRI